jgi:hypothetical protein
MQSFRRQAHWLNQQGEGDQAAFYLVKATEVDRERAG